MTEVITVPRKLDGKGRLILPGNFREAADFAPDQEVNVSLAYIEGEKVFIIAKRRNRSEVKRGIQ